MDLKGSFLSILLFCQIVNSFDYANQDTWGGICQTGSNQSPIDIDPTQVIHCPNLGYSKITFMCEDFTEVLDSEWSDYALLSIGQAFIFHSNQEENLYEAYKSHSLYWHTKSEHTISGEYADAELEIYL